MEGASPITGGMNELAALTHHADHHESMEDEAHVDVTMNNSGGMHCRHHCKHYEAGTTSDGHKGTADNKRLYRFHILAVLVLSILVNIIFSVTFVIKERKALKIGDDIRWLPLPPHDSTLSKIVFGSCAHQNYPHPHWDSVVRADPDLLILMGDNVYGDCSDKNCSVLKTAYRDWAQHASFIGLAQLVPIVATLDDHDYGQDNAWTENPHKDVAKELFLDFFDIQDERRHRPNDGVYQEFSFGQSSNERIQVIMLDTRYAKSEFIQTDDPTRPFAPDHEDIDKQILSPRQWTWLEQTLETPAAIRLIVSSFQVLNGLASFESWSLIPHEAQRLHKLLAKYTEESLVIILSGDRHVGGYYEDDGLYEVTSSSWTHTIPLGAYNNCSSAEECDEEDPRRIGDFVRENHYGLLEVDWELRTATVSLRRTEMTPHYKYTQKKLRATDLAGWEAGHVIRSKNFSFANI